MKASTIVNVLLVLAVVIIIALVAITGIEKEEKVECYKLQDYAENYISQNGRQKCATVTV